MKQFGEEMKGAEQLLTGELKNKLAHLAEKQPLVIGAKLREEGTLRTPGTESGRSKLHVCGAATCCQHLRGHMGTDSKSSQAHLHQL